MRVQGEGWARGRVIARLERKWRESERKRKRREERAEPNEQEAQKHEALEAQSPASLADATPSPTASTDTTNTDSESPAGQRANLTSTATPLRTRDEDPAPVQQDLTPPHSPTILKPSPTHPETTTMATTTSTTTTASAKTLARTLHAFIAQETSYIPALPSPLRATWLKILAKQSSQHYLAYVSTQPADLEFEWDRRVTEEEWERYEDP
ncbi:hypothetical protein B0A50_07628, partial [Salinomyces thailandicus]